MVGNPQKWPLPLPDKRFVRLTARYSPEVNGGNNRVGLNLDNIRIRSRFYVLSEIWKAKEGVKYPFRRLEGIIEKNDT